MHGINAGLSAEELELFAYLLEDEGVDLTDRQVIKRRDPHAEIPLSLAQERLWFLDQWDPGTPASNIPFAVRLTGQLSIAALEASLNEIVRRHETLRTTFIAKDGQPLQQVAAVLTVPLPLTDLRGQPEAELQRRIMAHAQHNFDLAGGPLLRAELLRLAADDHMFLLNIHHIVFDAWSVGLFLRELTLLYDAFSKGQPSPLPALAIQYPDFAIWQREWLQGDVLQGQLDYWKRQLGGKLPVLELPGDRPRPPMLTYAGALTYHQLPPALAEKLNLLSKQEGATLFMTLFAAYQVLLYRYTGEADIITGSMIANRDFVETEELLGFFVNTLLLRTDLAGNPPFRVLLGRVREMTLEAFAHQNVPFEQLVEELRPPRDTSHTPMFQTMFILQNAPAPTRTQYDLQIQFLRVDNGTSKFDLSFSLTEMADGIRTVAEYRTDLFDEATISRMLGHYQVLLEAIVADLDCPILDLPLLTAAETEQLLAWNATAVPYPRDAGLHTLFAERAARAPEALALIDGQQQISYGELEQRSNQLAHYLLAQGAGPGTLVGVNLARNTSLIVALLAILKTGAAYLPLDPRFPPERLAMMLEDASPLVLLTDRAIADFRMQIADWPGTICNLQSAIDNVYPSASLPATPGGANLAYVIYTSGSTGRPKGVRATHRGAVNRCAWMERAFPFVAGEVCAQKTALSFVDSVWEIFGPLLAGCPLVLIPDEVLLDIEAFVHALGAHNVSRLVLVPSLLTALLQTSGDLAARLPALKMVISSGEALSADLCARFHARMPGRTLINLYGSSEVAADATVYVTGPDATGQAVPIGRPIDNMQAYVLDRRMRQVPIGVPGEIYIGGDGLAEGYHQRPELTAERFVPSGGRGQGAGIRGQGLAIAESHTLPSDPRSLIPDPRSLSTRLYRTGDLGRYHADGQLEYLGRTDRQVKLRGIRIELEEIETLLMQHSAVQTAVVLLREATPGDPRLVAYVVQNEEVRVQNEEVRVQSSEHQLSTLHSPLSTLHSPLSTLHSQLRTYLRTRLPEFMLPSAFVVLDTLPLTPSGKVDRRALPAPEQVGAGDTHILVLPRTPIEKVLAGLWGQVLNREQIGVEDNFFDIGGHSLKATQLLNRVRETFHVNLPLRSLFQATTVAALAEVVVAHEARPGQADKIANAILQLNSISPAERRRLLEQKRQARERGK